MSEDKMSADKMSVDKMSVDKMSVDKISVDEMAGCLFLYDDFPLKQGNVSSSLLTLIYWSV